MKCTNCVSFLLFLSISVLFTIGACQSQEMQANNSNSDVDQASEQMLVFSKTDGFRHQSIEAGQEALQKLGEENGVGVTVTEDASMFTDENLSGYDAVIFLNTTMTVFNGEQRDAFQAYIQNGGGYAGIHSAADTEYDWPWYGELVGAYFDNHPPGTPNANVLLVDSNHPSTEMLPETWNRDDEWYNYQEFEDHINVLLELDTDSYEGSDHPDNHPIAWYHEFDGGRSFYTGLGHTEESFSDDQFLAHLWGGIQYAMGDHE
ncbi:MAG: ThuA domain-containing protein [Balneolaceae bacterium]